MKKRIKWLYVLLTFMLFVSLAIQNSISPIAGIDESTTAIYLNGSAGDDNSDGETEGTAVKTFAKAKEMATTHQGVSTIYITGTVPISEEISLEETNAVLKRGLHLTDICYGSLPAKRPYLKTLRLTVTLKKQPEQIVR